MIIKLVLAPIALVVATIFTITFVINWLRG